MKAREIWFLCRQYTAKEAEEMGMVNKVVPFDQLEDETVDWCQGPSCNAARWPSA